MVPATEFAATFETVFEESLKCTSGLRMPQPKPEFFTVLQMWTDIKTSLRKAAEQQTGVLVDIKWRILLLEVIHSTLLGSPHQARIQLQAIGQHCESQSLLVVLLFRFAEGIVALHSNKRDESIIKLLGVILDIERAHKEQPRQPKRSYQLLLLQAYCFVGQAYASKKWYSEACKYVETGLQYYERELDIYPDDYEMRQYYGVLGKHLAQYRSSESKLLSLDQKYRTSQGTRLPLMRNKQNTEEYQSLFITSDTKSTYLSKETARHQASESQQKVQRTDRNGLRGAEAASAMKSVMSYTDNGQGSEFYRGSTAKSIHRPLVDYQFKDHERLDTKPSTKILRPKLTPTELQRIIPPKVTALKQLNQLLKNI